MTQLTLKSHIPLGWAQATIENLIGSDGLFSDGDWIESKDQDPNGDVRLIQLADIGDGEFLDKSRRFLTSEQANRLGCTFLKAGDLLVARMPDPIGRACIFPGTNQRCVTAVDICIIRPGCPGIDIRWLMSLINSPAFRMAVESKAVGTTRSRISRGNLATILLPVPPAGEQRRIADLLDVLTTRSRRAKETLSDIPALLERFRQSVLAAAFRGDLTADWRVQHPDTECAAKLLERIRAVHRRRWEETELEKMAGRGTRPRNDEWKNKYEPPLKLNSELSELPAGWCWASLDELLLSLRNGIADKPEANNGLPILRISAVRPLSVDLNDVRFLPNSDKYAEFKLAPGDLLFTRYNGNPELVGSCGLVKSLSRETVYPDKLIRGRVVTGLVNPAFVEMALAAVSAREFIRTKCKTAAGQVGISGGDLRQVPVPLAPVEEQREIVAAVNLLLGKSSSVTSIVSDAYSQFARFEQAALTKAFSGELVPQDPNDEPASVLLERIRAEREAAASMPRQRRSTKVPGRKSGTGDRP